MSSVVHPSLVAVMVPSCPCPKVGITRSRRSFCQPTHSSRARRQPRLSAAMFSSSTASCTRRVLTARYVRAVTQRNSCAALSSAHMYLVCGADCGLPRRCASTGRSRKRTRVPPHLQLPVRRRECRRSLRAWGRWRMVVCGVVYSSAAWPPPPPPKKSTPSQRGASGIRFGFR